MSIQKENLKSKPNKFGLKKAYFWCTLIHTVKVKLLGYFFLQKAHLITKYLLPEKISLLNSLHGEIRGGGVLYAPPPAYFVLEKVQPFKG